MTWRVLISAPYMQPVVDEFRATFAENDIEVTVPTVRERLSEEELLGLMGGIDGVICGDDRFTEKVLKAASPQLKVIAKWGTGIDSIDADAAARLGILVCNTPDAFTHAVADTVMGYLLAFARGIPWADRDIRAGRWEKRPGISLRECTLGVIGVGNIGRAVVRRADAFGMGVLGNDIATVPPEFVAETGLELTTKDDLLRRADFVSLNCDLNPTSEHLIGPWELRLMKPTARLVNTARGPLVDEPALAAALTAGSIAGAALDVFEAEPLPQDSPLRKLDNVLFAPHNANSSPAAWQRVHENTIRNLIAGLKGER